MSLYCVVCKNGIVKSFEEKELILAMPIDETINNRFPFDDPHSEFYNLEVFKKGTLKECQMYFYAIDEQVKYMFSIELVDDEAMKLI